jgi:hypothetical protein
MHGITLTPNGLRKLVKAVIIAFAILLVAAVQTATAHAAGGFTFQPLGGTYNVGDTLTVAVHENSGTDPTNAVALSFTYPTAQLQYISGDSSDSAFTVSAIDIGTNGTVTYHRGSTVPLTGDQLVERAVFKVVGSGTVVLNFNSSSIAINSQDNHTNVAPNRGNASFTVNAVPSPSPSPSPSPGPSPAPAPAPAPSPAPKPAPSPAPVSSKPRITVTPSTGTSSSSDIAIPLTDDQSIQLNTPVDIEPATIQSDGISKVEYYLNSKLVKTMTVAPYTYHLDTTQLLNGSYQLKTKTYYLNGDTSSTTQTLVVKNTFDWTQFRLLVQKYLLLIILLILLIVAGIIVLIMRRAMGGGDSGDDSYPTSYDTGYVMPDPTTGAQGPPPQL